MKDPGISFSQTTYDLTPFLEQNLTNFINNPNSLSVSYAVDNTNVATISGNILTPISIGSVKLTATHAADANYAKGTATTTFIFNRIDLNPSLAWTSKTMKAWETISMPTLQDMPSDYRPTWNQCTYSSSDESVVKPAGNRNELIFGSSGYGKTATITITIPQTNKYNEKKLTYTVTVDNEMRIGSKADWQAFADQVNGENRNINATMTADVDLGTDYIILGRDNKDRPQPFEGTLDGAGHTLSINWEVDKAGAAPFMYANSGATFKSLRIKGNIVNHDYTTGGFVGYGRGKIIFTNCISEVDISSSANSSNNVFAAGFVGSVNNNYAEISFKDCGVTGTITGVNGQGYVSGFCNLYAQRLNVNFENCLFAGSSNGNANSAEFSSPATDKSSVITFTNCYYLNRVNGGADAQGTQVTAEQLKSGEITYKLQSDREYTVWGQTLGTDNLPQLFKNASCYVYKVSFKKDGETKAVRYATYNNPIYGGLPTVQDFLDEVIDPHHYYNLAFANGFNESTAVRLDKDVAVTLTDKEYFEIASADDWKAFCDLVNGGQTCIDARMTNDIDLEGNVWMIGLHKHPYSGTFDGQGNTLTINWTGNSGTDTNWAPFRYINGATIQNLNTKGSISGPYGYSGLVKSAHGSNSIQRCCSAVNIHATGNSSDSYSAGIVEWAGDPYNVTISDCIVTGNFSGVSGSWNGFSSSAVYIKNCLYLGTVENAGNNSHTFGYLSENVSNCYYLNPCGTAQGTQVTEDQLKSGEVAHLLQGDRTDQFWGQMLGTEDAPLLTANADRHVYKIKITYNNNEVSTQYANTGKTVTLPTAQDILGDSFDAHHYYALTFTPNRSLETVSSFF